MEPLAEGIIKKASNLIGMDQIDELVSILNYLKKRSSSSSSGSMIDQLRPRTASARLDNYIRSKSSMENEKERGIRIVSVDLWKDFRLNKPDTASMTKVDSYLEMLYDEKLKIEGAARIFVLTEDKDNLKDLSENETLMCVLARMFREDGKKSLEVATLVVAIFAQFSQYVQFHGIISQYKFGSQCLDLVQHEMTREESWFQELVEIQKKNTDPETSRFTPSPEYERSLKKYQGMVRRQNHFLRAAFFLLFNISEDKKVEIKMLNKGIVGTLVKSLEREAPADFFILILTFLTKLSIFVTNKNQMQEMAIIEKLYVLLSSTISSPSLDLRLLHSTFTLLFNLSFDHKLRTTMISIGILPKLLYLWSKDKLQPVPATEKLMLNLLYQMSRGRKVRGLFNFSFGHGIDSMDIIMTRVMRTLELSSGSKMSHNLMDVMALVINLSLNEKNVKKMCEHGRLEIFLDRVFGEGKTSKSKDLPSVLTVKLLRNISLFTKDKKDVFEQYVDLICQSVFREDIFNNSLSSKIDLKQSLKSDLEETFVIECLGILGNLINSSVDWFELIEKYHVWDWSKDRLNPAFGCEDDLILDLIVFLGTCCTQESSAQYLISNNDFFSLLVKLLQAKQEDDEIVLQIVFLFSVLCSHPSTRSKVSSDSRVTQYLVELLNDKNCQIRRCCREIFDRLAEGDSALSRKVHLEKFRTHNRKWIEIMENEDAASFEDVVSDEDVFTNNQEIDDSEFNLMLKADVDLLNSSSDSMSGSNLSTPSRMGWDLMDSDGKLRPVSGRPTTGYKRR